MPKNLKIGTLVFVLALSISACKKNESSEPPDLGLLPKPGEPAPKLSSCEEFLKTLPSDYIQGKVEVPENYEKPEGRKIQVAYYGKLIPGQTPTVFYNGGPGGSSWSSYRALSRGVQKDWLNTSFIYVDQRGNGCSDPYPEFTEESPSDEMVERYQHYGSSSIVRDSEVIRKKVWGDKPWKVFGQSYGAAIVHRYVILAPEGVVSAHAHANTINSDPFARMVNRIGSQGRVIKEFLKRFPEDEKPLKVLSDSLKADTCVESADKKSKACGFEITEALNSSLGFTNRDNWFSIHQWVNYLVEDDQVNMERLRELAEVTAFASGPRTPGRSFAMTVLALGDRRIVTPTFMMDYFGCKRIYEELKKQGHQAPETWPINECASTYQSGPNEAQSLKTQLLAERVLKIIKADHLTLDEFEAALTKHPGIPFYLYSGEFDTFVPRESFTEEVQRMGSRIHYTHFMGTGHEGFYVEPLVWKHLKAIP